MAGITPRATLSVIPGFNNESTLLTLAALDWTSANFFDTFARPTSDVLQIATLAAGSIAVVPPPPPAANSSYHTQFYGPSMHCDTANSSQQRNFDYYAEALANSTYLTATKDLYESGKLRWGKDGVPIHVEPLMNVFSAFSPYAGQLGWLLQTGESSTFESRDSADPFNNWFADIPFESYSGIPLPQWAPGSGNFTTQQLWIQTSDKALVCLMGNASFDVDFEYVDAAMTEAEYSISGFEPFWMPLNSYSLSELSPEDSLSLPQDYWNPYQSYMAIYLAFSSLLNGNVSTTLTNSYIQESVNDTSGNVNYDGNLTIFDDTSKILQHGLSACDEFIYNYVSSASSLDVLGSPSCVSMRKSATNCHETR